MNTGIQDMINLGWKLALVWQGKAAPELLDTYEQDRLPVIQDVVRRTETATDVLNWRNALVHQLITHLAPVFLGMSFVQESGTGVISEAAANYRASPLSHPGRTAGTLRAGDRVPDLDILAWSDGDVQGRQTSLYACLDPSRLTLLVTDGGTGAGLPAEQEAMLRPWRGLVNTQRVAAAVVSPEAWAAFDRSFGPGQSFLLARPDAYLGFVGENWPALIEWLRRWFLGAS